MSKSLDEDEGTGAEEPPFLNKRLIRDAVERVVRLLRADRSEKPVLLWTEVDDGSGR
jgi:hypothetical protein